MQIGIIISRSQNLSNEEVISSNIPNLHVYCPIRLNKGFYSLYLSCHGLMQF